MLINVQEVIPCVLATPPLCYAPVHAFSPTLFIVHSEGILRGGGERRQEIINSSSSWLTPPSHPKVEGQEGAEGEDEPAGVWWPWTSPLRSPQALSVLVTPFWLLFLHSLPNITHETMPETDQTLDWLWTKPSHHKATISHFDFRISF